MNNLEAQLLNQIIWNEAGRAARNDNNDNDMEDDDGRDGDGTLDGGVARNADDNNSDRNSSDCGLVRYSPCRLW